MNETAMILTKDHWPPYFRTFTELIVLGKEHDQYVTFCDPLNTSLVDNVIDMAKECPGISRSRIACLLTLNQELAEAVCEKAMSMEEMDIQLDG